MTIEAPFDTHVLDINPEEETDRIIRYLRTIVYRKFKKRGAVLGVSGGIDSSVVAILCLKAFGRDRVQTLTMPEDDSSSDTSFYSHLLIDKFNFKYENENIGETLHALKCYKRRNDAIREVVPEFEDDWKCKIVLPKTHRTGQLNFFTVVAESPGGEILSRRLTVPSYLKIVAATNFKQRVRKMMEYYYAEKLNFANVGTPNQLEYDQGFFVKYGDGAADVKPIAHLYKTQVYQLAHYLGVPEEIIQRPPTTDTFSMAQTQDEFYFSLPYMEMDLCLYGMDNRIPAAIIGEVIGLSEEQVNRVFRDIRQKRRLSKYLHSGPEMLDNQQSPMA